MYTLAMLAAAIASRHLYLECSYQCLWEMKSDVQFDLGLSPQPVVDSRKNQGKHSSSVSHKTGVSALTR